MRARTLARTAVTSPSLVARWGAAMLLAATTRRHAAGLSGVSVLPRKLTMPLRRTGTDPVPELAALRAQHPVAKIGRVLGRTVWIVTSHEQARAVLNDSVSYSTDIRPILGGDGDLAIGGLGFTDPPDHTRLRRYLIPEFAGRRLAALAPKITEIVEHQLDLLEESGDPGDPSDVVDFVSACAFPIPFHVICELLGLPGEDRERFRELGHARFDVTGGGAGTFGAMSRSQEFLAEVVRAQRREPGDGLIGALVRKHGHELDDAELTGLVDGVFTGGYETSASMLALGVVTLLRDREAYALAADDATVDGVVSELLRYLSVVQIAFPRFARNDMTLFGQQVRAGDAVVCSLSGANRDGEFADRPDEMDPSRPGRGHLAFGHGMHRCIGSELARMELRATFSSLSRRYPDMALAVEPRSLQFRELSIVHGIESVPVRLVPTAPATRP
ncbi:MAG: cytochrome P450 [Mycobacteriaceae bacterium]